MRLNALPEPKTLTDLCAGRLQRAILAGELPVGARLPPERDLAAQLGVTRVTVRGALARLAAAGLLSVRQGRGHTVQDFRRGGGPGLLAGLAELATTPADRVAVAGDLLQVRRVLARLVLEKLAQRQPSSNSIRPAVDAFTHLAMDGANHEALAQAESAILSALVDATGSAVLALCLNPVLAVLRLDSPLRAHMYREPGDNAVGYQLLLAWLDVPDPSGIDAFIDLLAERDAATLGALGQSP